MASKKQPLYEFVIPSVRHPEYKQLRQIRYLAPCQYAGKPGGFLQKYSNLERYGAVGRGVFVDPLSYIAGDAYVGATVVLRKSCVRDAEVTGFAELHGTTVGEGAHIRGTGTWDRGLTAYDSTITGSGTQIEAAADITRCRLHHVQITGSPQLRRCDLSQTVIEDSPQIIGLEAYGMSLTIKGGFRLAGDVCLQAYAEPVVLQDQLDMLVIPKGLLSWAVLAFRDGNIKIGCRSYHWDVLRQAITPFARARLSAQAGYVISPDPKVATTTLTLLYQMLQAYYQAVDFKPSGSPSLLTSTTNGPAQTSHQPPADSVERAERGAE